MPPIPATPIKLAILDDYQNISLQHFTHLKPTIEITVFNDTLLPFNHPSTPDSTKNALITRLKPYTLIASMRERTPFPEALLTQLPNLKLLLTTGRRNASIDMKAARELGIHVTGTEGVKSKKGPDSTTQHTVALILGLARGLAEGDRVVREGGWQTGLATGLSGKVFATVGLGRLGVAVARIMSLGFGMDVLCWSENLTQERADEQARSAGLPVENEDGEKTFKVVSKEELFTQADVLSVHYVLSDRSRGLIGKQDLGRMKGSALFVNTSRGPIVDDDALFECLKEGGIRGAALDVFEVEPLPGGDRWRTEEFGGRVLLSPHMGYVEEETMAAWYTEQAEIVERWVKGEDLQDVLLN